MCLLLYVLPYKESFHWKEFVNFLLPVSDQSESIWISTAAWIYNEQSDFILYVRRFKNPTK